MEAFVRAVLGCFVAYFAGLATSWVLAPQRMATMQPMKILHPLRGLGWAVAVLSGAALAQDKPAAPLETCRLPGVHLEAKCGFIERPLNEAQPNGKKIKIHYAVIPAVARNKRDDPVVMFAGGPGQSAIELSGVVRQVFRKQNNRRDLLVIDQRGTGRSMPLACKFDPLMSMAEANDMGKMASRMSECRAKLRTQHGLTDEDFTRFTTEIASRDVEAIRKALGYGPINAVGGSYGTRAALDYARQFPGSVRRLLIDGVAPPDMTLPESAGVDLTAALERLFADCEADAGCKKRFPNLRAQWQQLLDGAPYTANLQHPVSLKTESVPISRAGLLNAVRSPLYVAAYASALPFAISEAALGRFTTLMGLSSSLGGGRRTELAWGMHFSVVCAEDLPRMKPAAADGTVDAFAQLYRDVCAIWPQAAVSPDFYKMPVASMPVLVSSGGIDPVTPARHGERTAKALGAKAIHIVAPNIGHGLMGVSCVREALGKFIDAATEDQALAVKAECAATIPRPTPFVPPGLTPKAQESK
jgi:pimeloyl-ACP methyl ester carboxylesterase